jgi:hypothetical protein
MSKKLKFPDDFAKRSHPIYAGLSGHMLQMMRETTPQHQWIYPKEAAGDNDVTYIISVIDMHGGYEVMDNNDYDGNDVFWFATQQEVTDYINENH